MGPLAKEQKKPNRCKADRTRDRPRTGSTAWHLRLELDGEPMEPIERRQANLHPTAAVGTAAHRSAAEQRLPQQLKQQRQEGPPLVLPLHRAVPGVHGFL
jgi:hypothetical protein